MTRQPTAVDQIFISARTANGFTDKPVPLSLLRQVYGLAAWDRRR